MKKMTVSYVPYSVIVSYNLSEKISIREMDEKISSLAKKCKGKEEGSGAGFGERDISFDFASKANVTKFIESLKTLKTKVRISIRELKIEKDIFDEEDICINYYRNFEMGKSGLNPNPPFPLKEFYKQEA